MERSESRMTWAIIIGLIIIGGLASAAWPVISAELNIGRAGELAAVRSEPEPIVINIEDHLLGPEIMGIISSISPEALDFVNNNINGREISQPVAIGILVALTVGSLVLLGGPIALIYTRLETQASSIKEDETFQAAQAELEKQQQAELKEMRQQNPAHANQDEAKSRRGFAYTMAFLGIIFAWVLGMLIDEAFSTSSASLISVVIALLLAFVYFRFMRKPEEIDPEAADYQPVSWGWVWVVVSGMLIVGLGTGLAIALYSSAPPG